MNYILRPGGDFTKEINKAIYDNIILQRAYQYIHQITNEIYDEHESLMDEYKEDEYKAVKN